MSHIQIICTSPGMRRNGVKHPASAIYKEGHWTDAQLEAFKQDPAFIVQPVSQGGVQLEGADLEGTIAARVKAEVARLVELKSSELEQGFQKAVNDAVNDKTATLKGEHETALEAAAKKLAAAEASNAELQKKLDAATEKATAKK